MAQNGSFEYSWTVNPRIIWTSHAAIDRVHELSSPGIPTISSFNASLPGGTQGLPAVFQQANGIDEMPTFMMQGIAVDRPLRSVLHRHQIWPHAGELFIAVGNFPGIAPDQAGRGTETFLQQLLAAATNPTGLLNFTD